MFLKESGYTLYEDQESSVAALLDKVQSGVTQTVFVGATGSGKTAISAELKRRLFPRQMLFVVHRDILIKQTIKTLVKSGFDLSLIGVIAGGHKEHRHAPIQILSVQTAARRNIDWFHWDVAIFDEAHFTAWTTWAKKLRRSHHDKPMVYLTATPWRLSKKETFLQFVRKDNFVFAPLPGELIKMGRLCQPIYFSAETVNLSGIKKQMGDYATGELSVRCNDPDVINKGLKFWQDKYPNERAIAFCVDVSHAQSVTELANKAGRKAVIVHGDTPIKERERHYEALRCQDIDMIVSVDCLSEGFDVPNIRCVWMLRPTMSWAKAYQQMGRGLRVADGKSNCIILDQAGLLSGKDAFPLIEDLTQKDFYDEPKEPGKQNIPPRICIERDLDTWDEIWDGEGCHAIIGSKVKICPHCGYELPVRIDNKAIAVGAITEVKSGGTESVKRASLSEQQKFFIKAMDEAYVMLWHPAAVRFRYKERFDTNPPTDYYQRWVKYRRLSALDIETWLKQVERRKGTEVVSVWMPKLCPPEIYSQPSLLEMTA
jgi:superfamily II DNA or RNA helicase